MPRPGDAEGFGHGDLHAGDVVAIPDGFEKCSCKTEEEQILDGFLAQVVIDAEDARFGEGGVQVASSCWAEARSRPKGFSTITRAPLAQPDLSRPSIDGGEHAGRDGQVVRGMLRRAEQFAQRREGGRIVVIAVDVLQELDQFGEGGRIEAAVLGQAVLGAGAELLERPAGFGDADHGHVKISAQDHLLQRREDLLVGEIAGGAEEYQGVGKHRVLCRDGAAAASGFAVGSAFTFSPRVRQTRKRMAERSLSAKSASPRELKRSNSAALSTGAGAPSSIAAVIVQRPSPESETRPEKFARSGCLARAMAVRSSSHDATTLPRRQTSATSARFKLYW